MDFNFFDYIKISPDKRLSNLSKQEILSIIDKSQKGDSEKQGLIIEWDFTHSARRINNRLYSYSGQKTGLDSLIKPFAKPILKNHDTDGEPLGRFIGGEYVDLAPAAMGFFRDVGTFLKFQKDYLSDDPKRMYKAMKDSGLLVNESFPGLGTMRVKARITDQDAVEKFLDGRYLTFSANHGSDRYICSICGQDWMTDGICEHRSGSIYDGEVCVYITGAWIVKEGSVVSTPADDISILRSMQLSDSVGVPEFLSDPEFWKIDSSSVFITDSIIQDLEINMPNKQEAPQLMDPCDFSRKIVEGVVDEEITKLGDALTGETVFEINYLIQIHDSLHYNYDLKIGYSEDQSLPTDVYKLHARLHELADIQDFRGSIVNGALDKYSATGEETEEFVLPAVATSDSEEKLEVGTQEDLSQKPEVDPVLLDTLFALIKERLHSESETQDTEVDWDKISQEMEDYANSLTEIEDETLGAEEGQDATSEAGGSNSGEYKTKGPYCGSSGGAPKDTYPVNTKKRAVAALAYARHAPNPGGIKECVCKHWPDLPACKDKKDSKETELLKDYKVALTQIEDLSKRLEDVLVCIANLKNKEIPEDSENKLEDLWGWFGTIDSVEDHTILDNAGKVEDPNSIAINPTKTQTVETQLKKTDGLGDYEKKFLAEYSAILSKDGEHIAETYFARCKKYLPRGFHPSKFQLS